LGKANLKTKFRALPRKAAFETGLVDFEPRLHARVIFPKFHIMSFAEVLSEIPRLTPEQRRELLRRVLDSDETAASTATATFGGRHAGDRFVLVAPRIIQQAEVDAILEELP